MRTLCTMTFAGAALLGFCTQASAAQQPGTAVVVSPVAVYPTGAGTPLGATIDALLRAPAVAGAHWGIAVTAMDGTPLFGLDEAKLFRPASTAKIFTTAAALALLHPDATFATGVYGKLRTDGIVQGDLVLFGGADSEFGSHDLPYVAPSHNKSVATRTAAPPSLQDLDELADKLVARGVQRITGEIVGDDGLRPFVPYPEGWSDEDTPWGYGAPVSALTIANNELRLTVTPGHATGEPNQPATAATVVLDQFGLPFYNMDAQVFTQARGGDNNGVDVDQQPASHTLRVYGNLAAGGSTDAEHVAIDDPAAFAAAAFRKVLEDHGIDVDGSSRASHRNRSNGGSFLRRVLAPGDCERTLIEGNGGCAMGCTTYSPGPYPPLAEHRSAPLIQDVVYTLKTSQNLHAELLLTHLSVLDACSTGSAVEGVRMLRAYLLHAGLHDGDFVFYDGSGLSTKDLVTPRAEAQLLAYAAEQPWFPQWKAALPVGGVDGTLSDRFTGSPLKGHVFAKTGTLGESRALAGYVQCRSGREVIFAILDDNHEPGSSADRAVMDKMVEAIAANN